MQKKDLKLKRKLGLNIYTKKGSQTTLTGTSTGDTGSPISIKSVRDHTPKPVQKHAPCPSYLYSEMCPLPKSQFLSTGSRISKATEEDNMRLPPPDMEYLTRKPHPTLKWTLSSKGSSHVTSYNGHHDVFFIGTRHLEKEFKRTFMESIFGEEAASLVFETGDRGDSAGECNLTEKGSSTAKREKLLTRKAGDLVQGEKTTEDVSTTNSALKRGLVHGSPGLEQKRSCLADSDEVKQSHLKETDMRWSGCTSMSEYSKNLSRTAQSTSENPAATSANRSIHPPATQKSSNVSRSIHPPATQESSNVSRSIHPPATQESSNVSRSIHPPATQESSNVSRSIHPPATQESSNVSRSIHPPATQESSNVNKSIHPPATQQESSNVSYGSQLDADYDTSIDMEVLQDPAILQDFMDDSDSDSSSDPDLPRVNVTGRYSKAKAKAKRKGKGKAEPSGGLCGPTSRGPSAVHGGTSSWSAGMSRNENVWSSAGTCASRPCNSGSKPSGSSAQPSSSNSPGPSSDVWGVAGQGSSNIVERCPVCLTSFPPGFGQKMSSRLRGMKVVASTIIPRVQRLLETGVLEKRPLWLDVVEAYPPLPPPILPKSNKSAKSFVIEYPVEEGRRSLEESGVSLGAGVPTTQGKPMSLFERRSVKRIQQWPREPPQEAHIPQAYTAEKLETSDVTEPVSEEMLIPKEVVVMEVNGENTSSTAVLNDHQPHFEDTIKGLAALLKDHENQNSRK